MRECLQRDGVRLVPLTPDDLVRFGCVTPEQLRPSDGSYTIDVAAPAGEGTPTTFAVCVCFFKSVYTARVIDERGDTESSGESGQSADLACADASGRVAGSYGTDQLRQIRYCLWRWAARHDGSYPASLAPLAALGPEPCLPERWVSSTYVPGKPDAAGRLTTFVATERASPQSPERRLDESGTISEIGR